MEYLITTWLIILSITLIISIVIIARNKEMAWVLIKGITLILLGVFALWLYTPDKYDKWYNNLAIKWFRE